MAKVSTQLEEQLRKIAAFAAVRLHTADCLDDPAVNLSDHRKSIGPDTAEAIRAIMAAEVEHLSKGVLSVRLFVRPRRPTDRHSVQLVVTPADMPLEVVSKLTPDTFMFAVNGATLGYLSITR